jgi:GNAT superfamily N-acetyltransferase
LREIEELRLKAWSTLIGNKLASERFLSDPMDLEAWHVGLRRYGQLVGCGRISLHKDAARLPDRSSFSAALGRMRFPCCVMNRLVVAPAHRGQRVASTIDEARMALAQSKAALEVWVEAKNSRAERLEQLGFEIICRSGDTQIAGTWWILRKSLAQ